MDIASVVLLTNVASTWFMVGLIWLVQVVNYPQFARVGPDGYADYYAAHVRLISRVVALPMLAEAFSSALLLWFALDGVSAREPAVGMALIFLIWVSTAFLIVPRHGALAGQFSLRVHGQMVALNWIRTIAWTARGLLVLKMITLWAQG